MIRFLSTKSRLNNPINITQNAWVKIILEAYAIWINENGFGLFLRPILLSFKKDEYVLYNYELMEDSDELDDIIHTVNNENSIFIKSEIKIVVSVVFTILLSEVISFPLIHECKNFSACFE